MSEVCFGTHDSHAKAGASATRTADGLSLAAAPTFAIMALLTGLMGDDMLCTTALVAFPLNGMAVMYALMSAFHAAPWLRLISSRRDPSLAQETSLRAAR